jgi:hypothetical protein
MQPSVSGIGPSLPEIGRREANPSAQRTALAAILTLALLSLVAWTFWQEDWRYSRPTPRPIGLVQPALGASLQDAPELAPILKSGRITLVHVFNPTCPCSRFNVEHVRELVHRYGDRVQFVALLQCDDSATATRRFDALELDATPMVDVHGSIASLLGVYSTPQAVILRADGSLYYRGNYNRTRYCDDAHTEFARLAMEALLAGEPLPALPVEATTAYGCELPEATLER